MYDQHEVTQAETGDPRLLMSTNNSSATGMGAVADYHPPQAWSQSSQHYDLFREGPAPFGMGSFRSVLSDVSRQTQRGGCSSAGDCGGSSAADHGGAQQCCQQTPPSTVAGGSTYQTATWDSSATRNSAQAYSVLHSNRQSSSHPPAHPHPQLPWRPGVRAPSPAQRAGQFQQPLAAAGPNSYSAQMNLRCMGGRSSQPAKHKHKKAPKYKGRFYAVLDGKEGSGMYKKKKHALKQTRQQPCATMKAFNLYEKAAEWLSAELQAEVEWIADKELSRYLRSSGGSETVYSQNDGNCDEEEDDEDGSEQSDKVYTVLLCGRGLAIICTRHHVASASALASFSAHSQAAAWVQEYKAHHQARLQAY